MSAHGPRLETRGFDRSSELARYIRRQIDEETDRRLAALLLDGRDETDPTPRAPAPPQRTD